MTQKTPSRSLDKFVVRLPDGLRDRIANLAEQDDRSMNTWIVRALEKQARAEEAVHAALSK